MNDHDDTTPDDEDQRPTALYRHWHESRPADRGLAGARRRLSDELTGTGSAEGMAGEPMTPQMLYRRYREERIVTPPQTIDAIMAAVQSEAAVAQVAEAAPQRERSAQDVPAPRSASALARLFSLPGRLLDRAGLALAGVLAPGPMRRALPALALAGVALAVAPLLLVDRGADVSPEGATVAAVPIDLLEQATTLAIGIQPAAATGMGLSGNDREALAFNVGTTVTDLVVLVHAARSPSIERSLEQVRARLKRLAGTLADSSVTAAAAELDAGAMRMPDAAQRPALDIASDSLRASLADSPAVGVRYDLGGTLGFIELAASLDSGALQAQAFQAAFARLRSVEASAASDSLPSAAVDEIQALLALGETSGDVPADEVRRRVARLRLLLG